MRVIIDCECNSLNNPTHIWLIACKDIDTGCYHIFRKVTEDDKAKDDFISFSKGVNLWVGHNFLGYDYPVLNSHGLLSLDDPAASSIDTLVLSKLINYSRPSGHSIESYGEEYGLEKIKFSDWTKYSKEMETYCIRDVDINLRVYNRFRNNILDPKWSESIRNEQQFQLIVNSLHNNGFSFNSNKATKLLLKVTSELDILDREIKDAFPDKLTPVREIHPRLTRHGTLNKSDFRFVKGNDLSEFNGGPFVLCTWKRFNPSSHKQIVDAMSKAGWSPLDKTGTHVEAERALQRLKYRRNRDTELDIQISELYNKLLQLRKTGWKVNETNLSTLPDTAPSPARLLAKRILLEARRRTLTEWLGLVQDDNRIHGKFYGIGAWTHRMAHQQPNTANIPTDAKLYGAEMRSLWQAPRNRLLVGVDAEGIQLRIFAHYIEDEEFIHALVEGKKSDKSDPHSLNQRIIGSLCKTRQDAKRFIYALLLGAGMSKLAQILGCSESEAQEALNRLMGRYQGFETLKKTTIPRDAKRGYFIGLDGRRVSIPGDTEGSRRHLAMSGYLQNGEAVIMKKACIRWHPQLKELRSKIVNFVHDEWQVEVPNNMEVAVRVAKIMATSLEDCGSELKLKCPLAGSYWSEDHNDYTIGTNWSVTH